MTELEGAILGVLREGQNATPYAVRRIFQQSISAEWSGSAGAIYPAMRRLEAAGLIAAGKKSDGRGKKLYLLTKKGLAAHDDWLCDAARASGPGMDPFRTRAQLWTFLPAPRRSALLKTLHAEISERRAACMKEMAGLDAADRVARRLVVMLLDARLKWLKEEME